MTYFVEYKNKFITKMSFIAPLLLLSLFFLFVQIEYHLNIFPILIFFIILHIYIFFTKSLSGYKVAFFLSMSFMGFILQTLSIWGIFQDYYNDKTAYYLIGVFTIFYLLLFLDLKKASQIATHKSVYLTQLIHKVKVKKEGIYYVDDEKSTLSGKDDIPGGEMNLTSFYTFIVVTMVALPIILLGKFAIAMGILSARYFPNSHFILYGAMCTVGTIFFLGGFTMLLTYLKLDLSEEKDNQ